MSRDFNVKMYEYLRPDTLGETSMDENTISYGTASCGHVGQIFRTGKCAHCYIAELETDVKRLADKVLSIPSPLGDLESK